MASSTLDDRTMIEVRLVFGDGSQDSRVWTWADIEDGSKPPKFEPQEWMREPRRSWQNPQDPIIYSALVDLEHEAEAHAWLQAL